MEANSAVVPLTTAMGLQASDVRKTDASVKNSTIMIVDDESLNIKIVRKHLKNVGYSHFVSTEDASQALGMIHFERPDVVLLDVMMPEVNGLEILEAMGSDPEIQHIPVIILTAANDPNTRLRALELGATDFLTKPVDLSELAVRVRNALIVRAHHLHLANYSARLEHQVRLRTAQLAESRREVIHVLACAAEYRDSDTGNHVIRVGRYAAVIAEQLGLDDDQVELIEQAAILHDVGKMGIPDSILLKPGRLDPDEIEQMKQHCQYGMKILHGVPCNSDSHNKNGLLSRSIAKSPVLEMAATIAICHHEQWDGSGYPNGLKGDEIPLVGRITAVADVFDALRSRRPYKPEVPWEECHQILEEGRGSHFDPAVLDAFFARKDDIIDIQRRYDDPA